jgi:capsular polysaccharide transport system permease protein
MVLLRRHMGVLKALVIRDLMGRYGRNNLGFIWTLLEPMILCTGVMVIWSFIHQPIIHGVPIVTFVVTGYMPLTLSRHMINPVTGILRRNSSLLYHQPLSHVHILLARSFLEFLSTTAALLVIYFVLVTLGLVEPVADLGPAFSGWMFAAWFYGAVGMLLAALTELWETAEKFIQPMQYLAMPISGTFFLVDWMPGYAQKLLLLNPAVHCFEMFRAGFLGEAVTTHYDPWYLAACSTALTVVGSGALYNVRNRIQIT